MFLRMIVAAPLFAACAACAVVGSPPADAPPNPDRTAALEQRVVMAGLVEHAGVPAAVIAINLDSAPPLLTLSDGTLVLATDVLAAGSPYCTIVGDAPVRVEHIESEPRRGTLPPGGAVLAVARWDHALLGGVVTLIRWPDGTGGTKYAVILDGALKCVGA